MNLKNSIYKLSFAAMISMMAMNATEIQAQGVVPAQKGEKAFTLEDLNFGGNNYRNMVAKNRWCTWWGNELIHQDIEACYLVNKTTGKETKLFGINDINQWIAPTKDIKVRALYNAQFPFAGKSIVMVSNGSKTYTIDFKKHKLLSEMEFEDGENLLEANAQQNAFAYLKGSNLYVRTFDVTNNAMTREKKSHDFLISKDGSREIVYGQSVHRDEFGISKGTFWSPNGELLAFYRMDQSMVTDYPQVDIPEIDYFNHPETQTCCAKPAPDKYPMTGETSHKVTVGVFDCMTGKTIYLKAGDPTDRYFTNIAWSPDSKTIYMFELNRDQNDCRLTAYSAETGKKTGELYRETDEKYVEPCHPIQFLPWDSNSFIMQSRKDGYNHLYLCTLGKHGSRMTSNTESLEIKQLTSGKWEVMEVLGFNAKRKSIIIASNECSPIQRNIFTVDTKTGKRTMMDWGNELAESGREAETEFSDEREQTEDELDNIDTKAARERLENGEADRQTEEMLSQMLTGDWEPVTLPSQEENKPVPDKSSAVNFHISDDRLGEGSPKEKFQRNVAAIRLLEQIEGENRYATPEEQQILSQYVGWGGLADAFDESKSNWSAEYRQLRGCPAFAPAGQAVPGHHPGD